MLIQKPLSPNDIITVKLITGDELVAKLVSFGQDTICITKPMLMTVGMDEYTGKVQIQMSPYFILSADQDSNFTIKTMHVIIHQLASDQAKSGYIQNTSGLKVASTAAPKGIIA
jgi:hypothetical protein